MVRSVIVVLLVGCGGPRAKPREQSGWPTCEERCAHESEWYVGCLSACRDNAPIGTLSVGDAGLFRFADAPD